MRAIVRKQFGGPEVLEVRELADPTPKPGHVLIEVEAFGVNHAETHMRKGEWPEIAEISGIECVGTVKADPDAQLAVGQKIVAFMGGMGRTINGSYAEYTNAPRTNVIPIETDLSWEALAAIPESYATAWTCLYGNLGLQAGQTLLIRGATSGLGQAAVNIAAHAKARVIATTRNPDRFVALENLGAGQALREGAELIQQMRKLHPDGVDAVLDLVGNSTVLSSLTLVRRGGHVCEAGWLGGLDPIESFNPMLQMPSGVHYSLFGSFVFGSPQFPVAEVPMQTIIDRAAAGVYRTKPFKVFSFDEIQAAHELMESGKALGKIVVKL
ncbi:MAG: zinc-binding dehydrogenase [Verrucomicrobia bacterium]|nr:zinc-binding dehydrogenase [Verrucomicrobiota bacterium]